jgi:hypothetical protein
MLRKGGFDVHPRLLAFAAQPCAFVRRVHIGCLA